MCVCVCVCVCFDNYSLHKSSPNRTLLELPKRDVSKRTSVRKFSFLKDITAKCSVHLVP